MYVVAVHSGEDLSDGEFVDIGLAVGADLQKARRNAWELFLSFVETYCSRTDAQNVLKMDSEELWTRGLFCNDFHISILRISELRGGVCTLRSLVSTPGGLVEAPQHRSRKDSKTEVEDAVEVWEDLLADIAADPDIPQKEADLDLCGGDDEEAEGEDLVDRFEKSQRHSRRD